MIDNRKKPPKCLGHFAKIAVWSIGILAIVILVGDLGRGEDAANETVAGHSYHGEAFNEGPRQAAMLMPGTGNVDFPVASQVENVQAFINQGVGQLHGFWYFEAERTFRQAAALDPSCAAAYWGMAMANANNRTRAVKFIERAMDLREDANDRVRLHIEALERLLTVDADDKSKLRSASDRYVRDLEEIVFEYPNDLEAKALIAVHLWQSRRNDQKIRSHLAVDALIEQVLRERPLHPVHHYRIHLWDYEKPERALESASLCGQSSPAIAHMWHMPGHIYSRLKRYADAVWQQEASARTDHAQMMRDQLLPDQIHNFAHNNEWLIRNLVFIGRLSDGLDLAKNMTHLPRHPNYNHLDKGGNSASYGRTRLLQVLLAGEMWHETIKLAHSAELPLTEDTRHMTDWYRAVGGAYHRLNQPSELQRIRNELRDLLCQAYADAHVARDDARQAARSEGKDSDEVDSAARKAYRRNQGDRRRAERALNELEAYLLVHAGRLEPALQRLAKTGAPKSYQAWLHLRAGKTEKALEMAQKLLEGHEQETLPLAQLAAIQWEAGRMEDACQTMRKLREISEDVDLTAAPFSRLAPVAAHLEWPRDWRLPAEPRTDIGDRPDLDLLGPFRWQPPRAPDWSLIAADGHSLSLSDLRGRPVVLIFYLGWGCLHCAEQLQAFGPQTELFRDAGFELLAISSDDAEGLSKSLENYDGGDIPFPLLADPTLDVFRKYRVFDDFENQPLHGTFVIDGRGRILWHDISYEPFMDHEFVLAEGQRLLSIDW